MPSLTQLMIDLNLDCTLPLYEQVQRTLRNAVQRRILRPDQALPAERALADGLGVSRVTVRKAIDGLVSEGVLLRRPRAGTFVGSPIEKNCSSLSSFSEDMLARGRVPHSTWLKRGRAMATVDESLRLNLSPGALVYRLDRVRYADGVPLCIEYARVAQFALGSEQAVQESIFEALELAGLRPVRAVQRLSALALDARQAGLLNIQAGAASLAVERTYYLTDGRAVKSCRWFFRSDLYNFVAELGG